MRGNRSYIDLTGRRVGLLTAVRPTDRRSGSSVVWECRCDCGNTAYVPSSYLRRGITVSCGCSINRNAADLTWQRFGNLTAIRPTDRRSGSSVVWECRCDCGNTAYVSSGHLRGGNIKSCGCSLGRPRLDFSGARFGNLTAIRPTGYRFHRAVVWECRCDCGNTVYVPTGYLRQRNILSCGCLDGTTRGWTADELERLVSGRECSCCVSPSRPRAPRRTLDLTGQRFGRLTVLRQAEPSESPRPAWKCQCDCGNIAYVTTGNLRHGGTKSCGCLRGWSKKEHPSVSARRLSDITGQRFGLLTAIRPTEQRSCGNVVWECRCDCGNTAYISKASLLNGFTRSCGCLRHRKSSPPPVPDALPAPCPAPEAEPEKEPEKELKKEKST